MSDRPYVFIGSSTEGLPVAQAIQANLEYVAECQIWSQGVFGLSDGTLARLVQCLDQFDFAILVLTPDDFIRVRGTECWMPRDNVLLELGLFIGGLGGERIFMVVDRSANVRLPSDLAGITPATYEPPQSGTMQSALGTACTAIQESMEARGRAGSKVATKPGHIYWLGNDLQTAIRFALAKRDTSRVANTLRQAIHHFDQLELHAPDARTFLKHAMSLAKKGTLNDVDWEELANSISDAKQELGVMISKLQPDFQEYPSINDKIALNQELGDDETLTG